MDLLWSMLARANSSDGITEVVMSQNAYVCWRKTGSLLHDALRPDRIFIGEVRGAEALALLKAWNTGHPGGVTTIQPTARGPRPRDFPVWFRRPAVPAQPELIAEAINLLAFIVRTPQGRRVTELARVERYDARDDFIVNPVQVSQRIVKCEESSKEGRPLFRRRSGSMNGLKEIVSG
jgi:hypothetical protein